MRSNVHRKEAVTSREGFEAFCHAEHPRLVGMMSLYCGDSRLAEELAQDALAIAWRDWAKVQGMTHASAWVARVAINRANSLFRRKAAERRAAERSEKLPLSHEHDLAESIAIRAAVANLPARQRTVLVLHYFMDLTFREIADLLGAPEPTVKSLSGRAIAALREHEDLTELEEASGVV